MNTSITLQRIIWEEVRNYRLAKKAQQLSEQITFTPAKTADKKATTTAKPTTTTTTQTAPKSSSPFKSQEEASKFHKYASEHIIGGSGAKPEINDPKLIDLYYKHKDDYKKFQATQTALKKTATVNPDTGLPDGGTSSMTVKPFGETGPEITVKNLILGLLAVAGTALIIGLITKRIKNKRAEREAKNLVSGMSKAEFMSMMQNGITNASNQELITYVGRRSWFMERITNIFRKNKREVNNALKDMNLHAVGIDDVTMIEIGDAVGKQWLNKQAYVTAKQTLLKRVVKLLNAGRLPRGISLEQFINHLTPAERAKWATRIEQRWNHLSRKAKRKKVATDVYNKGKKVVQNLRK